MGSNDVHLLTFQLIFIILVRVIISDKTLWPVANWEGKNLFGLHFHLVVHHWRKVIQELKQSRNWWQKQWESTAYWLAQPAFLEDPGPPPRDGITHNELGPLTSIINLKNTVQTSVQPDPIGAFFQSRFLHLWWLYLMSRWQKTGQHTHIIYFIFHWDQ